MEATQQRAIPFHISELPKSLNSLQWQLTPKPQVVKPVGATELQARNIGFLPSSITNGGAEQGGLGGCVIPALNDEADRKERQRIDLAAIGSEWPRLVRMDSTETLTPWCLRLGRGGRQQVYESITLDISKPSMCWV